MTDLFLETHQIDNLSRIARNLAESVPLLEAATARHASRPLGNLVRATIRPASTPPINLHALDLTGLLETSSAGWVACLADDTGIPAPDRRDPRALCHHLALHADRIAAQPWAADALDELADLWVKIEAVIDPRDPRSITDHRHSSAAEIHHLAHQATGTAEDMAVVHHRVTGLDLKPRTLYAWRARGKLPNRRGPAGEVWFHYFEVAQLARLENPKRKTSHGSRICRK